MGILALDDAYGTGLAEDLTGCPRGRRRRGGRRRSSTTRRRQTFDAEVGQIETADPDAIMVIGFDESSRILTVMVEQGIGPKDKAVYGIDGNMGNALGENFDAGK